MKYIIKPATQQAYNELLKAAQYTEDAFDDLGSEGYYDTDEQERIEAERRDALDRLKHAIDKVEFIIKLDRAIKNKEVKA